MPDFSARDSDGHLHVEPVNDRCPRYLPKAGIPSLNRCACCRFFDAAAWRCLNEHNKAEPTNERAAR